MILVGAGLHGHVDQHRARLAEFRRIVAGLKRDFLNRIRAGLGHLGVVIGAEDA